MRCKKGSFLVEALIACFMTAIITASVVSIIRLSIVVVCASRDSLAIERAREMALSYLCSGESPPMKYSSGISILPSSGSQQSNTTLYKIIGSTFRGVKESFVVWPNE